MPGAIHIFEHGGPEVLEWLERDTVRPERGQLRVKVLSTSVNFADIQARRGGQNAGTKLPFVPGLDAVGIIEELGEGVQGFELGECVAGFPIGGSYADEVIIPDHLAFSLGTNVPQEVAASLTTLVTAYNIVYRAAQIQQGETVLVHAAAGGVGHLAVQFARLAGAAKIFCVVGSEPKAEFLRGLGTDVIINRRKADFEEIIDEMTKQCGVDVILDSIGGETSEKGLRILAPFGRLITYGHAGGRKALFPSLHLHRHSRSVIGYSSGHHRQSRPEIIRQAAQQALRLAVTGHVRVHVGAEFALQDAERAHTVVETGAVSGRVLLHTSLR